MVKFKLKGEHYIVYPEFAVIVRDAMQEKGEGEVKIPVHKIGELVSTLIREKQCSIEEYAEINGRDICIRQASPGNWSEFAEYLVGDSDLSRVGGIIVQWDSAGATISLSSVCTFEKTVIYFEFRDTEIFSNLVHVLYEQNIKEVVYKDKALEKLLVAMGIAHHCLSKHPKGETLAEKATGLIEDFFNLRTNTYTQSTGQMSNSLRMDGWAAKSLLEGEVNLWDEIRCTTVQGRRLLRVFIRLPLICRDEIERRHSIVEEMLDYAESIKKQLARTPDILVICKKLAKTTISIQDVLKITTTLTKATQILDTVSFIKSLEPEINTLKGSCSACEEVLAMIDRAIDPTTQEIRANQSIKLADLYTAKQEVEKEILLTYNQAVQAKNLQKAKVKLETNSIYGYHMKIPRTEGAILTGTDFIQLSAQKAGIFFTTIRLKQLDAKLKTITADIQTEADKILQDLRSSINAYRSWLEVINHMFALIDVFASLAEFAKTNGFIRPTFTTSEYNVQGVYHPLLPAIHRRQSSQGRHPPELTKNDLQLTATKFCVLTGPNMGGKTTFLKTIAMITLLAQMGSFIPADSAHIPIFNSLFIRIGAADSPEKNISTFMAEMNDVSKILNEADQHSLVIIDELGRGTSDADGYAIAQAATEHILSLGATTLFATHFYDICHIPGVCNKQVSCILTDTTAIMTYKVEDGIGQGSYGLNVAKYVGFPKKVIEIAENILNQQND
ncbi:DNA mismatch repair protein MSH2 [Nematocida homosporus]|uniref:DNA mismatch repair protein MSH2 n=1 Tax=Nematocida homosporus TaxID=1912981 RepID=UPI00221E4B56|nr:DNA mismatch repair protein MSH2 [Nematocida homosporus]KAI5185790.1 DNA mismatch repair protein MSH2 [Nematocida homosporus]